MLKSISFTFFIVPFLSVCFYLNAADLPKESQKQEDTQAYQEAYNFILEEDWQKALSHFEKFLVSYENSRWSDDARFWSCYAHEKISQSMEEAFACYENFIEQNRGSKWINDAKSNLIRLGKELSKSGKVEYEAKIQSFVKEQNEEIVITALYALQSMGDEKALKELINLYEGNQNKKIQDKILIAIGNFDSPEANDMLMRVAKREDDINLRKQAIFWLGQNAESQKIIDGLLEIANSKTDSQVKEQAVFAISQAPESLSIPALINLAKKNSDSLLREKAIFWLGQEADSKEIIEVLEGIVNHDTDSHIREQAIFAISQATEQYSIPSLVNIAKNNDEATLREKAVFWLGQNAEGSQEVLNTLEYILENDPDQKVREKAVFALYEASDELGQSLLIKIAKNNNDPFLREKATFWLGQGAISEEVVKVLQEIAMTDSKRSVREQAVFALSQVENNLGTLALIEIAKNHPDIEMRKKAIFWLGQSDDPRARNALLEILKISEN